MRLCYYQRDTVVVAVVDQNLIQHFDAIRRAGQSVFVGRQQTHGDGVT